MTLLVVGASHRSAPLSLLDRTALSEDHAEALLYEVFNSEHVAEVLLVTTCNRIEVYAEVARFHGALDSVTAALAKHSGVSREELTPHLYALYEDRAVEHLFDVAAGLDSMVVGEQQILGQVRAGLRRAQEAATAGRTINSVGQAALRVGKRVHTETGIDRAGASMVSVALGLAAESLGGLGGRHALVVGAGAISTLAATTLRTSGIGQLVIANRTTANAERLAATIGARALELDRLGEEYQSADLIISGTGAMGVVIKAADVEAALAHRGGRLLVIVDLAVPHDTDPELGDLPGVIRIDLDSIADRPDAAVSEAQIAAARTIIADEIATFIGSREASRVDPIVVSLRARADEVVSAEIQKLRSHHEDSVPLADIERSMRRLVSTLLHTPTVRMKEFATQSGGHRYAEALQALFDLDPDAIAALTRPVVIAQDVPGTQS